MLYWKQQTFVDTGEIPTFYLLTDSKWKSKTLYDNGPFWGYGVTHRSKGLALKTGSSWLSLEEFNVKSNKPKQYILAFTHPIIAILLNRAYMDIDDPIIWECHGKANCITNTNLAYCDELTTERISWNPRIALHTRMRFGFGCVSKVYKNETFLHWLLDWISGGRSQDKARDMADYCLAEVRREQKKCPHCFSYEGRAAWAAQWMCWAAVAFGELQRQVEVSAVSRRLVELYTAQSAIYANLLASNSTDFNLITIAEITMAAK